MTNAWIVVLQQHLASLPPLQQQSLKATTNAGACLDIIRLARGRQKGYDRLLLALQGLIDPIKRFEGVIDVIVQVNSDIASPIWGPLRLVLGLASERLATLQNITALLERLVEPLFRFQNYEALFHSNAAVNRSIYNLYTPLIGFCAAIIRYHSQSSLRNVLSSFDKEFREASESIRHCWTEVDIAANAANIEEAQLARAAETSRRAVQIRTDVLRWLCPSNVQDDLREQSSICMANSCEWILESPEYNVFTRPGGSTVLTILGRPGEGKTFLATFVVETLLRADNTQVLYFFCKAGDPEKRSVLRVLQTLLAQLLRSDIMLSEVIEEIYYNNGHAVAQSLVDVQAAFGLALQATQSPDVCIVIDGLDECQNNLDLIRTLLELTSNAATAQKADGLKDHGNFLRLDATYRTASIRAYALQRVSNMRVLSSKRLQQLAAGEVCSAAQGLWLYARLMLDEIQHLPNITMIQHQLRNIPRGLQQLYTQILTTLASTIDDWQLAVAQQIFLWVDFNDVILTVSEDNLSLAVLEIALQYVSMGEPVHDSIPLIRRLGGHMVDVFEADDSPAAVDFIHHTARQYVEWSSTAPSAQVPVILKPRRLRELHCAATAAWYLSQHPKAKSDCHRLRQTRGALRGVQYFEMAYALWDAFKLADLPSRLDDEESIQITELCSQLIHFLSSDQCLTWIEMAVLINYAGGYSLLLDNVEDALAASSEPPASTHSSFEAFRQARHVFFTDYAYVICRTGPNQCLSGLEGERRAHNAPAGFYERPLARKLLQIGRRYSNLHDEV
ncbi:hypothetical protein MMC30_008832 [Trapelia coarctata]|nr:hypothetical protein [Trapelia coarctata]